MMGTFKKVALSGGDPKVLDEFSMPEFYLMSWQHGSIQEGAHSRWFQSADSAVLVEQIDPFRFVGSCASRC